MAVTIAAALMSGCSNPEEAKKIEQEIVLVNQNISDSITENLKYGEGSAIHSLITLRLSIYKQSLAMLEQKKAATWYSPRFSYSVDGKVYNPPDDLASKISTLEIELANAQKEMELARSKALLTGGLVGLVDLMNAETKSLTVAQLNSQLIALRSGFPQYIEYKSNGEGNISSTTQPASKSLKPTEAGTISVENVDSAERNTSDSKKTFEQIDLSSFPGVIKPAAFGYYYGLTQEQIESVGIKLEVQSDEYGMVVAKASSAPIHWDDADFYYLFFIDGKLLKISAYGKNITDDPTGTKGKSVFEDFKSSLIEKYGKPSDDLRRVGLEVYKEVGEFYQCLSYVGCGYWATEWKTKDKIIGLELNGLDKRGSGYLKVIYEANPEYVLSLDTVKASKRLKTKKGL